MNPLSVGAMLVWMVLAVIAIALTIRALLRRD